MLKLASRKNPVDSLKSMTYGREICRRAGIKPTGYQIELFLSGGKLKRDSLTGKVKRSCKWDRILSGKRLPNQTTIDEVGKVLPECNIFLDLPLWEAIHAGEKNFSYWKAFYKKLPPQLQKYIFKSSSGYVNRDKRKRIIEPTVNAICRFGNVDALACLIAFYREMKIDNPLIEPIWLEFPIRSLFLTTCTYAPFSFVQHELLSYLLKYIFTLPSESRFTPNPWNINSTELERSTFTLNYALNIADDLELVTSLEEQAEFFYWFTSGNSKVIMTELFAALESDSWKVKSENDGLGWLIHKLNLRRRPDRKITKFI